MNCECGNRKSRLPFWTWLHLRFVMSSRYQYRKFRKQHWKDIQKRVGGYLSDEEPPDEDLPGPEWGTKCANEWAIMILFGNQAREALEVADFLGTLARAAETKYYDCMGTIV